MKRILIIAFLFIYSYSNSQTNGVIEVNPNKKIFIFFKSKIVKGESLPNRTLFEFDKEKGSSIGTITGEKNNDSNLLVTTADGLTYSFSLKYTKRVGKLNYFIEKKEATNYTKDMEASADTNKELTMDKNGLIVMKGATAKPKVEIETEAKEEEEALAAARLEKENLEKQIKEEEAALKRAEKEKVTDKKEATIIKNQEEVEKQQAIPKAATDITIGAADGGFGLNLSYNKILKKGYMKYGLNGAFSKINSSLTKTEIPLSVYTFDMGYFIPLVHKTKVNFAIGGGGLLGYETIKSDDVEITGKNNFVYGAYIGTEFAYRFTDKVGLLLKYNQNFYLNSDIGNTAPYYGIGLRFYTNKKNN